MQSKQTNARKAHRPALPSPSDVNTMLNRTEKPREQKARLNTNRPVVFLTFSPVQHCDHLAWARESWYFICFSCMCVFILHALHFVFLSSCWRRGLPAVCDCGTSWTFHLTFLMYLWYTIGMLLNSKSKKQRSILACADLVTHLAF